MRNKIVVLTLLFTLSLFVVKAYSHSNCIINDYNKNKSKKLISTTTLKGGQQIVSKKLGKELVVHITYYTNIDNELQGGHYDKVGNLLTSHNMPIVAMPSSVPYGSYIDIEGLGIHKVVDTGGAITWISNNECYLDMFIPNVSEEWIYNNTENISKKARLYINGEHF